MKKSFETSKGPKQAIRDRLCDITQCVVGTPKSIFTLPGREGLCVKTFRKRFGQRVSISGVEREPSDWDLIYNKGINVELSDISNYAKTRVNKCPHFDLVFLDYFGALDQSKLNDIKTFLNNPNIIHKGKSTILGITLSKHVSHGRKDRSEARSNLIKSHTYYGETANTLDSVGQVLSNFIACELPNMETVRMLEAIEYRAEEGSSTMYFYCLELKS